MEKERYRKVYNQHGVQHDGRGPDGECGASDKGLCIDGQQHQRHRKGPADSGEDRIFHILPELLRKEDQFGEKQHQHHHCETSADPAESFRDALQQVAECGCAQHDAGQRERNPPNHLFHQRTSFFGGR